MNEKNTISEKLVEDLLESSEPLLPDSKQADRIFARVKEKIQNDNKTQLPVQDLITVGHKDDDWIEPFPGNKVKMLRSDTETQSFLVKLDPGTRFPAHYHPKDEETLVMEGEVLFGDIPLKKGDYHLARAGSSHDETYSEKGCLLFIRAGTEQNQ